MQKVKKSKKCIDLTRKKPSVVFCYLRAIEDLKAVFPSLQQGIVVTRRKKNNIDLQVSDL